VGSSVLGQVPFGTFVASRPPGGRFFNAERARCLLSAGQGTDSQSTMSAAPPRLICIYATTEDEIAPWSLIEAGTPVDLASCRTARMEKDPYVRTMARP
jgi:hypothetical protein